MADPQVAPITEKRHAGGFVVSEDNGGRSRDAGTLITGQKLDAGTVLGKITVGTASSAAFAAANGDGRNNTGNGTMGAVTVSAGAKPGKYKLTIIEPGSDVGTFVLEDPDGDEVGTGVVATAFSAGGLAFTLADGSTDFVSGDGFNITVAAGSAKYAAFDPTAANGTQNAAAVLWDYTDATSADKAIAIISRAAQINSSELNWGANVTTGGQKTAALAQLAALGIIAR